MIASVAAGLVLGQLVQEWALPNEPGPITTEAPADLAPLNARLSSMEHELSALRAALSRASVDAVDAVADAPTVSLPQVLEDDAAGVDEVEAQAAAEAVVNADFATDRVDAAARAREGDIRRVFELPEMAGLSLAELECRTRSCKLVFAASPSDPRATRQFNQLLQQPGLDGEGFAYRDDDGRLVVHSMRRGTKLNLTGS